MYSESSKNAQQDYLMNVKLQRRKGAHHLICWKRDLSTPYVKDFQWWMVLDLQTIYIKYKKDINQISLHLKLYMHIML